MNAEGIFFELLQVALGNRQALSATPTGELWMKLYEMSKKHALTAIALRGFTRMKESLPHDDDNMMGMPESLYVVWVKNAIDIAHNNDAVNRASVKVSDEFAKAGFMPIIIKGQGNAIYYQCDLRECRMPGDVDVWVGTDRKRVIDYLRQKVNETEARIHHMKGESVDGVPVEVHYWPMFMYSFVAQRRFERFCKNHMHAQWNNKYPLANGTIAIPTPSFNAVYQMVHILRHLFEEGIGLKQLLDYYFLLRALHIEREYASRPTSQQQENVVCNPMSNEQLMHLFKSLGMETFTRALMWVLQHVFALPDAYLMCTPDEHGGRIILEDVMRGGNFGTYDDRKPEWRNTGYVGMFVYKMKRNANLLTICPREVIAAPFFRIWHLTWRHWNGYVPKRQKDGDAEHKSRG